MLTIPRTLTLLLTTTMLVLVVRPGSRDAGPPARLTTLDLRISGPLRSPALPEDCRPIEFLPGLRMPMPVSLNGVLTNAQGTRVGSYQEDVKPIYLGDVLIGTTGTATFTFVDDQDVELGVIRTVEVSLIYGLDVRRQQLDVGSVGTIIDATGIFRGMDGGFTTKSDFALTPAPQSPGNYRLSTKLQLNLRRPLPERLAER